MTGHTDAAGRSIKPISWKAEWAPLASRFAERVAVEDAAGPTTYAELYAAAAGVARRLWAEGVEGGGVVAILLPNARGVVSASLGVMLSGAAEALVNPALALEEVEHCLAVSGARWLLTSAALAPRYAGLGAEVLAVEEIHSDSFEALPEVHVDPGAWARIVFTSGTTGKPKGIVHDHGGRWIANTLQRATLPIAPGAGNEILLMTPYAHGASLMTQAFLDGGAAVRLLDGVDVDVVADLLSRGAVDQIFAPPTVLAKLVSGLEGRRIDGIGAIFTGTAPLAAELYRTTKAIFGPVVRITYGKTETFNPITVLRPEETDRWYDDPRAAESICVGWPASGVEVVIRQGGGDGDGEDDGDDDGGEGPPGAGLVLIRAQHMLAATLTGDGVVPHDPEAFHRTGDLGFLDEIGRLHLVGRESDVIKTGGYRVTPNEIENALKPALAQGELVVLGLPSAYWGEVITVVAAGAAAGWEAALAPAIERLTRYKRPRLFAEVPEISRNALGKVVRGRTRDAVLDSHAFVDGRYPRLERRS